MEGCEDRPNEANNVALFLCDISFYLITTSFRVRSEVIGSSLGLMLMQWHDGTGPRYLLYILQSLFLVLVLVELVDITGHRYGIILVQLRTGTRVSL